MTEPVPDIKPRYDALAESSGLFIDPSSVTLRTNPLQQLWREHNLAQQMVNCGLYDEGHFMFIHPMLNYHAKNAADAYLPALTNAEDKVRFLPLTLEAMIGVIQEAGATEMPMRSIVVIVISGLSMGRWNWMHPQFGLRSKRQPRGVEKTKTPRIAASRKRVRKTVISR